MTLLPRLLTEPLSMIVHRALPRLVVAVIPMAAVLVAVTGCEEDAPPPPPPPPPPVVVEEEPEAPTVTSIKELMERYGISDKIEFAEADAPDNDPARIAILKFFDAFAKGDAKALEGLASEVDRQQLAALVADGSWSSSTEAIELIEIKSGSSPETKPCAYGQFSFRRGDDQAGLWLYTVEGEGDDIEATFDAELTPPHVMAQLSGTDPIGQWYRILGEFLALAEQPDVEVTTVKEDRTVKTDEVSDDAGEGGSGTGTVPGRRPPPPLRSPGGPGGPSGN